jgi:L-fuconolactonase
LIKGIVGWVDFEAPNAASRLTQLARHPKFKGVRPMLQSLPDDNYILRDSVLSALNAVVELNLRFDALVFTRHLASIAVLAHRWPQLQIVIDHAAKPPIVQKSAQATQQWHIAMSRVAEFPNIQCKLSGLFTEMDANQSRDDAIPYVEHVLKVFGAERVMWGSDWPVLKLRNSYPQWHEWVVKRIAHLDSSQQAAIMGGNAIRFYGL